MKAVPCDTGPIPPPSLHNKHPLRLPGGFCSRAYVNTDRSTVPLSASADDFATYPHFRDLNDWPTMLRLTGSCFGALRCRGRADLVARTGAWAAIVQGSVVILMLGAMLAGCAGDRPPSSVSRRDSAGIAIVESGSPRWGAGDGWTIDPQPLVDLATSGAGANHEFFRVVDAMRPDQ